MTKNQLVLSKAPEGIAGVIEASNKINFLRRLFDLETRQTIQNDTIQVIPKNALGFALMCFNFDGQNTIVLPIADFMSPAKLNDRQYKSFLMRRTHYTGFFELKASAL